MAAPSGKVTMLFTDVEGSTRLLERLGDEFAGLLATHHRVVRDAVAARGGHEVGCEGDGFFVVFPQAGDAVRAAADIQRALAREHWPGGVAVRVRMGLHTGEPRLADGDYVGLDVHRAARIGAAAHGGQVVVGESTRRLLAGDAEIGLGFRSLGRHRLKDLSLPLELYQVTGEGLAADFPPLRTLDAPRTNLPAVATSLVGRERELAGARALLGRGDVRLLTLTGTGGAGKTRLALAVAGAVAEEFPGGAYVAFLAGVPEADLVLPAVAAALAVRDEPGRTLRESLLDRLGGADLLLVLDNLEHLPGASPVVAELLAEVADLKVLATSRAPLRVSGEHELDVPPLDEADGVELFAQRARAVRPGFDPGEHAAAVEDLCRRLDGLPLAIELAAARVRLLTPEALLQRLDRRLDVLTGGLRDAPERHRTLRATVAWSYDLLGDRERAVLRRLAVFAGGIPLDLAGEVADPDGGDVLAELESLVEGNLLRTIDPVAGEPRFVMLETIRAFALERLAEHGEEDETRLRHAEAIVGLLERAQHGVRRGQTRTWTSRVDALRDDVRVAVEAIRREGRTDLGLRLAAAVHEYAVLRGRGREVADWLQLPLGTSLDADPRLLALGLSGAAAVTMWNGDAHRARAMATDALRLAEDLGDPGVLAWTLMHLSTAEVDEDSAAGRLHMEQGAELARRVGDAFLLMFFEINLGDRALVAGDPETAQRHLHESVRISERHGLDEHMTTVLINVAAAHLMLGQATDARAAASDALRLARRLDSPEDVRYSLANLVAVDAADGRPEQAARLSGTVDAAFDAERRSLIGFEAERHQATLAALREQLGPARLEELRAEGRLVPVDDAVAAALAEASEVVAAT